MAQLPPHRCCWIPCLIILPMERYVPDVKPSKASEKLNLGRGGPLELNVGGRGWEKGGSKFPKGQHYVSQPGASDKASKGQPCVSQLDSNW